MDLRVLVFAALWWLGAPAPPQEDPVAALVLRLEEAANANDTAAIRKFGREESAVREIVSWLSEPAPANRAVLKERDRTDITGGHRLLLEAFAESGAEGRLVTFTVDLEKGAEGLRIASATRVANVSGLHRLALDRTKQFDVKDLTVRAPDLTLHMPSGSAFVAETPDGPTVVVLLGRGEMRFTPPDPAEQTQVRIFSGSEALVSKFDAAFIRVRPSDFSRRFLPASMVRREAAAGDLRRATDVFEDYISRTLQIDLGDLSRERWSITPQPGDLIAEVRTDKHGSLTYTRSTQDAEDVTVFDRGRRKNIAVYASAEKLAKRGRFYSEDDLVDYDVLEYELDARIRPDQQFVEGNARIKLRVVSPGIAVLNLRLAETLVVRGVYSPAFGRILHLRVVGQNSLIVSLPATLARGSEVWLNVLYAGRVLPQDLDREAISLPQDPEAPTIPPEPRYLYSHRAYWYPQPPVSDYATARLRFSLPNDYDVLATGTPDGPALPAPGVVERGQRPHKIVSFTCERPVRYLAFVITRLRPVNTRQVEDVAMTVLANARQSGRARGMSGRAEDILRFYRLLVGRAPYPSFTIAFTERDAPGGHSPAYFAVVDQAPHTGGITWRNDPVNFDSYPSFFVAHEIAHQWWGQAVGWKNYHEQWISEGFAQYFALLYAERHLDDVAPSVLKQMRQTAIAQSAQGPVYLGYRLGHIKGQAAVFRAIVYNKSAMVLHMLRRLVGDDAFFKGVREFYAAWEFKKAGTGDFQATMEQASGRKLDRFFSAWIFGQAVPRVRFSQRVAGDQAIVRFEQDAEPVDIPITVTLNYASGESANVIVAVADKVTEQRIPLKGPLRSIDVNEDHGALAIIRK